MKSAQLFLLARIYGSYDISRVADSTSYQIIGILVKNSFKSMGENAGSIEHEINNELIKKPETFKEFCKIVKNIGKPNYHPTYMINHGMNAMQNGLLLGQGKVKGNGIKEKFNENQSWVKNMRRCGK